MRTAFGRSEMGKFVLFYLLLLLLLVGFIFSVFGVSAMGGSELLLIRNKRRKREGLHQLHDPPFSVLESASQLSLD